MIRLFVSADLAEKSCITLDEKQHHYVRHVMRLNAGDELLLFNGRDGLWRAQIERLDKKQALVRGIEQVQAQTNCTGADLYMALVKKEAMDFVVQKAVELGVRAIHPVICARSVVSKINRERLQQIAVEAAEQCERLTVPVVQTPVSLAQALDEIPERQAVAFLNERGENAGRLKRGQAAAFFIGPEGGWTPIEIKQLAAHPRAVGIHLDGTILRADTAALTALACYQFDIF